MLICRHSAANRPGRINHTAEYLAVPQFSGKRIRILHHMVSIYDVNPNFNQIRDNLGNIAANVKFCIFAQRMKMSSGRILPMSAPKSRISSFVQAGSAS